MSYIYSTLLPSTTAGGRALKGSGSGLRTKVAKDLDHNQNARSEAMQGENRGVNQTNISVFLLLSLLACNRKDGQTTYDPTVIDKSPLKEYEKQKIRILQRKFGCKWTEIAAQIPGRTGLMVKNYWYNEEKRAKHQMRNKMAISRLLLSPNEIEEQ
ncbi:1582_t:CDS:2, partial [Paraglomus brasilianum]